MSRGRLKIYNENRFNASLETEEKSPRRNTRDRPCQAIQIPGTTCDLKLPTGQALVGDAQQFPSWRRALRVQQKKLDGDDSGNTEINLGESYIVITYTHTH